MEFWQIVVLAIIQGAAELLPVSSSAHVIFVAKLMDPNWKATTPESIFLLIMLHTGTMFAAIMYFWSSWKTILFAPKQPRTGGWHFIGMIVIATGVTGFIALGLQKLLKAFAHVEVEELFDNLPLIAAALGAAGILILIASRYDRVEHGGTLSWGAALVIGLVQGFCLPFRGFSRSGATISMGLLRGVQRRLAENFSFALAVVLTPPLIVRQVVKLSQSAELKGADLSELMLPGLVGMVLSFLAGLLALRLLSAVLELGRWAFFGIYCLAFAAVIFVVAMRNGW